MSRAESDFCLIHGVPMHGVCSSFKVLDLLQYLQMPWYQQEHQTNGISLENVYYNRAMAVPCASHKPKFPPCQQLRAPLNFSYTSWPWFSVFRTSWHSYQFYQQSAIVTNVLLHREGSLLSLSKLSAGQLGKLHDHTQSIINCNPYCIQLSSDAQVWSGSTKALHATESRDLQRKKNDKNEKKGHGDSLPSPDRSCKPL